MGLAPQRLVRGALGRGGRARHRDLDDRVQVAARPVVARQPAPAQPQARAAPGARRAGSAGRRAAAEQRGEEVAEAAEVAEIAEVGARATCTARASGAGGREVHALLPVLAERVVLAALLGVLEHLVRLV